MTATRSPRSTREVLDDHLELAATGDLETGTVVLFDVTITFSQGVTCEPGGVSTSFTGAAGPDRGTTT